MGQATYPAGITRDRGETLALSSTVAILGIPPGMQQAVLYNPATDWRFHVNPTLVGATFYDASAAAGARYKKTGAVSNLAVDLQDRSTTGKTGTVMDAMQTGDRWYLCFYDIIAGFRTVHISGSVNANAAVLTVNYRKNDDTWADTSATDGTASGGKTFAVDGNVTFTAPTDWKASTLFDIVETVDSPSAHGDAPRQYGYWLQLTVSAALSADVELDEIWAIHKDTNRSYMRAGQEYNVSFDRRAVGAIEAILAAGTDTMEISWSAA